MAEFTLKLRRYDPESGQPPYWEEPYGQQQAAQQSPWAGQRGGWAQQPGADQRQ